MRDVYIAGVGQVPVQKNGKISEKSLAAEALGNAFSDAGLERSKVTALFISNMTSPSVSNQQQLGAIVAEEAGISGIEAVTVEAACGSGGAASIVAIQAVASGFHDIVAVCGVERMSHAPGTDITKALAFASDWELEGGNGASFMSLNAKLMRSYIKRYKVEDDAFSPFALNAYRNGFSNPNALFHKEIDAEQYREAKVLTDPLRLYDISSICNGAAAVVYASKDAWNAFHFSTDPRIKLSAAAAATAPVALAHRSDILKLEAAEQATQRVLKVSKFSLKDIDLFELHDAYTIMSVLSLEAAGFAKPGTGLQLGKEGRILPSGDIPISTMGGLISRGHPIGATGIYQVVEVYNQLAGRAGANQIKNAYIAMTQNFGGTASTVINHIFQRVG